MNESAARYLHPSNLLTYLAVLGGLCAVFASQQLRSWSIAGGLIALCVLADTFDGKFARLFTRNASMKDFGVQLDSLADALNFGLVPVVCMLALLSFESVATYVTWCAAASFYVISAITRLGVYNLQHSKSSGFVGLPTTVAGLIWSSMFLMQPSVVLSAILFVVLCVAMVSPIPFPRPRALGMAIFVAWAVLLVGFHSYRWLTL